MSPKKAPSHLAATAPERLGVRPGGAGTGTETGGSARSQTVDVAMRGSGVHVQQALIAAVIHAYLAMPMTSRRPGLTLIQSVSQWTGCRPLGSGSLRSGNAHNDGHNDQNAGPEA